MLVPHGRNAAGHRNVDSFLVELDLAFAAFEAGGARFDRGLQAGLRFVDLLAESGAISRRQRSDMAKQAGKLAALAQEPDIQVSEFGGRRRRRHQTVRFCLKNVYRLHSVGSLPF